MRQCWIVISLIIGLQSCVDSTISKEDIIVLGHAGAGFPSINNHFPINSRESIEQALFIQQADGVEVDIQLTADGHIVLYHDARLESGTNDSGFISTLTWEELSTLKRRDSRTSYHAAIGLWRLNDLLRLLDSMNANKVLSLNIQNQYEVEDQTAYNQRWLQALEPLLTDYDHANRVIVETADFDCLNALEDLVTTTGVKLFLTRPITKENLDRIPSFATGFVTNYLQESTTTVAEAQSKGYQVALYGVKIRQDIGPAINMQPDFIQTDNVPLTLSFLGR